MAITDLTNTRWKCNTTITTYLSTWYNVNVVCSTTAPDGTTLTVTGMVGGNAGTRFAVSETVWGRPMLYWSADYRYDIDMQGTLFYSNLPPFELLFNDGADNGNTDLINWLQANATLQETPTTDTKPVYKRVNGTWVKQDAFQRVSGAWIRISTKEAGNLLTTSNNEILQDSNGNNLEFKEI